MHLRRPRQLPSPRDRRTWRCGCRLAWPAVSDRSRRLWGFGHVTDQRHHRAFGSARRGHRPASRSTALAASRASIHRARSSPTRRASAYRNSASRSARSIRGGPLQPLPGQIGPTAAAQHDQSQDRCRQSHGPPPPRPLARRPCLGLLSPRLRLDPRPFRRLEPLLHSGLVGRDPTCHLAGVPRPPLPLGRQAVLGQRDQVRVGPAGIEPAQGVGQVAPRGLGADLFPRRPHKGRSAGQDFAEDRPQAEHVGSLVDPLDLAAGLLRGHVRGRAQHAARLRLAATARPGRSAPSGSATPAGPRLRPLFIGDAPLGQDLGQAPIHHLHFAEVPTITLAGFRSRWITRRAWA